MPKNDPADIFRHINMIPTEPNGCWQWTGNFGGRPTEPRPYFMAEGKRTLAARWVWELVNGPIPDGMKVLHTCDNGSAPVGCCNPAHLTLGTTQDNSNDMKARARHGLPHSVVAAIRRLIEQGKTQLEIAELYGVSRELISAISTEKVYKHVGRPKAANVPPSEPPSEGATDGNDNGG